MTVGHLKKLLSMPIGNEPESIVGILLRGLSSAYFSRRPVGTFCRAGATGPKTAQPAFLMILWGQFPRPGRGAWPRQFWRRRTNVWRQVTSPAT
jgi:hypothetical protein